MAVRLNGKKLFCHISERDLRRFFRSIEKSAYTDIAMGPCEFFGETRVSAIARCEECTRIVLTAYELAALLWNEDEMMAALPVYLAIQSSRKFSTSEKRQAALVIC